MYNRQDGSLIFHVCRVCSVLIARDIPRHKVAALLNSAEKWSHSEEEEGKEKEESPPEEVSPPTTNTEASWQPKLSTVLELSHCLTYTPDNVLLQFTIYAAGSPPISPLSCFLLGTGPVYTQYHVHACYFCDFNFARRTQGKRPGFCRDVLI